MLSTHLAHDPDAALTENPIRHAARRVLLRIQILCILRRHKVLFKINAFTAIEDAKSLVEKFGEDDLTDTADRCVKD
jgi:hypothetical protein